MIDLHSHILPGIDDGADSMEDALEMARIAVDGGTDVIVAASHGDISWTMQENIWSFTRKRCLNSAVSLKRIGSRSGF